MKKFLKSHIYSIISTFILLMIAITGICLIISGSSSIHYITFYGNSLFKEVINTNYQYQSSLYLNRNAINSIINLIFGIVILLMTIIYSTFILIKNDKSFTLNRFFEVFIILSTIPLIFSVLNMIGIVENSYYMTPDTLLGEDGHNALGKYIPIILIFAFLLTAFIIMRLFSKKDTSKEILLSIGSIIFFTALVFSTSTNCLQLETLNNTLNSYNEQSSLALASLSSFVAAMIIMLITFFVILLVSLFSIYSKQKNTLAIEENTKNNKDEILDDASNPNENKEEETATNDSNEEQETISNNA